MIVGRIRAIRKRGAPIAGFRWRSLLLASLFVVLLPNPGGVLPQRADADAKASAQIAESLRNTDKVGAPISPTAIVTLVRAKGKIHGSLYASGRRNGVPNVIMRAAVHTLGLGFDIQRDFKLNDGFEVIYEARIEPGGKVRIGSLRYASVTVGGIKTGLYRYKPEGMGVEYFNAKGQSFRSGLVRTPLDGARISSGFGKRNHPILGFTRMHLGLDFAGAEGTPVYAAGHGVVEVARWRGNYGNYIRLRHADGFRTAYAHLKSVARGLKPTSRVRQGQVIGLIGTTGLSTGAHLHYEVHKNGKAVDPAKIKLPPRIVLKGKQMAQFRWHASLLMIRPAVSPKTVARIARHED